MVIWGTPENPYSDRQIAPLHQVPRARCWPMWDDRGMVANQVQMERASHEFKPFAAGTGGPQFRGRSGQALIAKTSSAVGSRAESDAVCQLHFWPRSDLLFSANTGVCARMKFGRIAGQRRPIWNRDRIFFRCYESVDTKIGYCIWRWATTLVRFRRPESDARSQAGILSGTARDHRRSPEASVKDASKIVVMAFHFEHAAR